MPIWDHRRFLHGHTHSSSAARLVITALTRTELLSCWCSFARIVVVAILSRTQLKPSQQSRIGISFQDRRYALIPVFRRKNVFRRIPAVLFSDVVAIDSGPQSVFFGSIRFQFHQFVMGKGKVVDHDPLCIEGADNSVVAHMDCVSNVLFQSPDSGQDVVLSWTVSARTASKQVRAYERCKGGSSGQEEESEESVAQHSDWCSNPRAASELERIEIQVSKDGECAVVEVR